MQNFERLSEKKEYLGDIASRQQEQASNPKYSVFVEASAGTGKTKVLSDRVLRLLLEGVEPSKILCLTYTKAAAVEMKTRINDRLAKWAVMRDEDLCKDLEKLYYKQHVIEQHPDLPNKARKLFAKVLDGLTPIKIETIHAFCEEILKKFPLEAGVSPYFEVMDDQTINEILINIGGNLLSAVENSEDESIQQAVLYLANHIKELKWTDFVYSLILNRHALLKIFSKFKDIEDFKNTLSQKLNLEQGATRENYIEKFWKQTQIDVIKKCGEALLDGAKESDQARGQRLIDDLNNFDFDDYFDVFLRQVKSGVYESRARLACVDVVRKHENIELILQAEALRLLNLYESLKSIELYKSTVAVATIALRLILDYEAYKRERSCMDFDDLIEKTNQLLEKTDVSAWVLYKLDAGIDHILIDEAQDTSFRQWRIIEALSDEFFSGLGRASKKRTIFAVGDRKQSIFGFQGAEPKCFEQMRQKYEKIIPSSDFKTVDLEVSFRSTKAVLDMVNMLLSSDEAKKGVVDEGKEVVHLPYRVGEGGLVEIWPLTAGDEKQEDVWEEPVNLKQETSATTKLALKIARQIKKMVSSGEILASKGRPIKYSDFMVLVWHRKPFMEEFVRACKQTGVNITGIDRLHLIDEIVVEDLCALSQFLLLVYDDLSLAAVLKSPLYQLTEEDLFELCYNRSDKTLWERLCESDKYVWQKQELSKLIVMADYMRPFELFDTILNTMGGKKRFYERLGVEAKDAINEFMNLTLKFEAAHVPNLQNFMTWINANDIEIKRELEQASTDAVRLMTVHTSKGLQAPIVILPDTTRCVSDKREQNFIFDDDVFYFPLSAEDYNLNCYEGHQKNVNKESDEYRRLLYVAATRAEDRLYIAGIENKKTSQVKSTWYDLCDAVLSQTAEKTDKGKKRLTCAQETIAENKEDEVCACRKISADEVKWLDVKPQKEDALTKPYSPSHIQDMTDEAAPSPLTCDTQNFKRGTLIHKLLQMLPQNSSFEKQQDLIEKYLIKQTDLSAQFKENIKKEVLSVLGQKDFAFIFEGNSRAEVPIMGMADGKIISGQIDRLVVLEDNVIIVDFKTNRPAARTRDEVLSDYVKQLEMYEKLVRQIYPSFKVEKYILWTNTLKLMKI